MLLGLVCRVSCVFAATIKCSLLDSGVFAESLISVICPLALLECINESN